MVLSLVVVFLITSEIICLRKGAAHQTRYSKCDVLNRNSISTPYCLPVVVKMENHRL